MKHSRKWHPGYNGTKGRRLTLGDWLFTHLQLCVQVEPCSREHGANCRSDRWWWQRGAGTIYLAQSEMCKYTELIVTLVVNTHSQHRFSFTCLAAVSVPSTSKRQSVLESTVVSLILCPGELRTRTVSLVPRCGHTGCPVLSTLGSSWETTLQLSSTTVTQCSFFLWCSYEAPYKHYRHLLTRRLCNC